MKQTLKYIYERLISTVNLAESKYAITIALSSGVIVFASTFISNTNIIVAVMAGGCIVFALISVLYGFVALSAKRIIIHRKKTNGNFVNLMYYKTIMKFDEFGYVNEIKKRYGFPKNYKPDEMDLDLARQIIALSRVINIKFLNFNLSLVFLLLSILLGVGLIIILGGLF